MILEYEKLVEMFENSLLTELRGHGAASDFLRTWVPDPEPIKSLINMADAADIESVAAFEVSIAEPMLSAESLAELKTALRGSYTVAAASGASGRLVLSFKSEAPR